jgi:hypothetical protein
VSGSAVMTHGAPRCLFGIGNLIQKTRHARPSTDTRRRLSKRLSETQMPVSERPTIRFESPRFFSGSDERAFFRWLSSIPSVDKVAGKGTAIEVRLSRKSITQRDLRELIAICERYRVNKRPLREFDRPAHRWFRDRRAYWYEEIFG